MSGQELFETLSVPDQDKIKKYYKEHYDDRFKFESYLTDYQFDSLYNFIAGAFHWGKTEEGLEYWFNLATGRTI